MAAPFTPPCMSARRLFRVSSKPATVVPDTEKSGLKAAQIELHEGNCSHNGFGKLAGVPG
jgi:hypothetical protein